MNIHEHQAKAVLAEFGVAVPRGYPAFSVDEAVEAAKTLGGPVWVVKSQIHAGGRGKGRFEGLGADEIHQLSVALHSIHQRAVALAEETDLPKADRRRGKT